MDKSEKDKPSFLMAALVSGLFFFGAYKTWFLYHSPYSWIPIILAVIAGYNLITTLWRMASFLYGLFLLFEAYGSSDIKGSAAWASIKEIRKAGLHKPQGIFLGRDTSGRPLFVDVETHGLTLSPSGGGKTICTAIPMLCHSNLPIITTDMDGVLEKMTGKLRKKRHKHKVYRLDPAELNGKGAHRYNPVQILVDDWVDPGGHKNLVADSQDMSLQLYPDPPIKADNQYFIVGSRRMISFSLVYEVTHNEEKNATLGGVLRLLRNEDALLDALGIAASSDILEGELADMANDLLKKFEAGDKRQIESFREGAVQALEAFAPSGWLAESTSTCDFRFKDFKDDPADVFLIADPTKMKVFAPWLGLIGWAAITELTRCRNNKPVLFLLDEATNFKIEGLSEKLTTLRQFGCRVWFLIQELQEYKKQYGAESLETLLSQTEVKQVFGTQSQKTAELISKMLGDVTVKASNYQLGHAPEDKVQKSLNEAERKLLTPDEVRRFPDSILFIRNMKPIHAIKTSYAEVKPWSKWVEANPQFGKKLKAKIKVWLSH